MNCIILVFLSTFGVVFTYHPPPPPPSGCSEPADIVFILDESTSIKEADFRKQLDFVQGVIRDFDVGSGKIHIGVLTFSNGVEVEVPLGEYSDEERLKAEIGNIKQQFGDTYINLALIRLREEMSRSARRGVRHLAIVITDGESTDPYETKKEAELCHRENYEVLAVGVGTKVSKAELETIASNSGLVFTVASYADLQSSLREKLTWETCRPKPPPLPPTGICNSPADIVFVLDESGSIATADFRKQLDFVKGVVDAFDVSPGMVHIGVMTFSTGVEVPIPLGEHADEAQLKQYIENIRQQGGSTYTNLALERLRREMSLSNSARPGVRHVAIVITDGQSTEPQKTAKEAELCHREDYEMFAVGVGASVSKAELETIASDSGLVFTVASYDALDLLRERLQSMACPTIPRPPPPPLPPSPPKKCSRFVDLIWSISVRADSVEKNYALEFINSVIMDLQTYSIDIQVGLTPRFCDEGDAILLKGYDTNAGFWREVERSRLAAVRSDRVIEYIRLRGFSAQNGGRSDTVRFGILIVDSTETDWENTVNEARLAKEAGIRLVVIGVGSRVDQGKLKQLAWSKRDYFYVTCYSELNVIKIRITSRFCVDTNQKVWKKSLLESLYDF